MPERTTDDTLMSVSATGGVASFGPPAVPGEVGTLGPYRFIKQLGKGGMGAVYAALDTRLDRRLALKVMLPAAAADEGAKERFLREARAAARVKHDNVVIVYEADERNGVPYIAMEFLEGCPLDTFLNKNGPLPVPQVLRVAAETAAGLAAAHALGLVHRDIKPANLWLEVPNGRVKVLDFGLAKPVDTEVELTKCGEVVGTPAYMSPEQGRGLKVDARSDLFSLGSVLYRLCTGALPFTGPTTMAVLMALGNDEPKPVRELNPDVPEPVAALIHELLAKNPDARPQSAAEVVARVRAIASGADPRAPVMRPQVVYAVTPVTAAADANPFADLDSHETELVSRDSLAPGAPGARSRSKWPPFAAGGTALVALAVVAALALKGGRAPEPSPKDDTAKAPDDANKPPPPRADAERAAAEWVIAQGGSVHIKGNDIRDRTALPKEPFVISSAALGNTNASDAGLVALKGTKVKALDLSNTLVTDAGLEHLKGCPSLADLRLTRTKVTAKGATAFRAARPVCRVTTDGGTLEPTDADRAVSEWVLAVGGYVRLNGGSKNVVAQINLPKSPFALTAAHIKDTNALADGDLLAFREAKNLVRVSVTNTPITDAGLAHLARVKGLAHLDLSGTRVTGPGLAHLKECDKLELLVLSDTKLTADGLAHLKDCKNLQGLSVLNVPVGDAGLARLGEVKGLKVLNVRNTGASDKAVAALAAALPGCKIEHDGSVIEPKK